MRRLKVLFSVAVMFRKQSELDQVAVAAAQQQQLQQQQQYERSLVVQMRMKQIS